MTICLSPGALPGFAGGPRWCHACAHAWCAPRLPPSPPRLRRADRSSPARWDGPASRLRSRRSLRKKRRLSQTVLWHFGTDPDPKRAKKLRILRIRIHHTDYKQCFGYGYDSRIWPALGDVPADRLRSRRSLRKKRHLSQTVLWIRDMLVRIRIERADNLRIRIHNTDCKQ